MEPTRRSTRLQEKKDYDEPRQNKRGKARSQTRGKSASNENNARSKSKRGKSKSNTARASTSTGRGANTRARSQSISNRASGSGANQTRGASKRGRKNTGKTSKTDVPKNQRQTRNSRQEESDEEEVNTRHKVSKRKADELDSGETNKRRSASAKKVKKTDVVTQKSEPKSRRGKAATTNKESVSEQASEDLQIQQQEEQKLEVIEDGIISSEFKKPTNKKKVEGTNKKADKAASIAAQANQMSDLPPEINVLEILVQVKGNGYSIWRKVLVSDEIYFTKFARIIVTAMGWMGYRDWAFKINNITIMVPPDDDDDREKETEFKKYADTVRVDSLSLKKDDKISFIYGVEENPWVHEILVEGVHKVDRNPKNNNEKSRSAIHGVVVTGMNSCPRDDFNPKDYEKAFDAFKKGTQEYKEWKDKLGDYFNPEAFDKEKINRDLKIHVYDDSNMDPELREEDKMFKW